MVVARATRNFFWEPILFFFKKNFTQKFSDRRRPTAREKKLNHKIIGTCGSARPPLRARGVVSSCSRIYMYGACGTGLLRFTLRSSFLFSKKNSASFPIVFWENEIRTSRPTPAGRALRPYARARDGRRRRSLSDCAHAGDAATVRRRHAYLACVSSDRPQGCHHERPTMKASR